MLFSRHSFVLFMLIFSVLLMTSRDKSVFASPKWKPITSAEMNLKEPLIEKTASREALFWEVKIDGLKTELTREEYVREKIFNEFGVKELKVLRIVHNSELKLDSFEVRITQPDGQTIELNDKQLIVTDIAVNEDNKIKSEAFILPNLQVGSIIDYKYSLKGFNSVHFLSLELQKNIPIHEMNCLVRSQYEYFPLKMMRFNIKTDFETGEKDEFTYIKVRRIPSVPNETHLPPGLNQISWVLLFYDDIYSTSVEKYWKEFAKKNSWFFDKVKINSEIETLAKKITEGSVSNKEKIFKIWNFCKTDIRNLSFEKNVDATYLQQVSKADYDTSEIIKKREGVFYGIERLFVALTSALNFETRIVFTGDRRRFFLFKEFTNQSLLSYTGIAVKIDNQWHFYNPGAKLLPEGSLYWYHEGQDALFVGKKDSFWTRVPISEPNFSQRTQVARFKLSPDGSLEGKVSLKTSGHFDFLQKSATHQLDEEGRKQHISNRLKEQNLDFEILEHNFKNTDSPTLPFESEYKVKIKNYAKPTGKRLLINPGFFNFGNLPPFSAGTRQSPIYFHFHYVDFQVIEIEIPEELEPEFSSHSFVNSNYSDIVKLKIDINYDSSKRVLRYVRNQIVGENGRILYPKESYLMLKDIYDQVFAADSYIVSIKKKNEN